jgi:hypothetical protein
MHSAVGGLERILESAYLPACWSVCSPGAESLCLLDYSALHHHFCSCLAPAGKLNTFCHIQFDCVEAMERACQLTGSRKSSYHLFL